MKVIVAILIFCLVLFLYLHIFFHLKTSSDLEVYEIDQPSKDKLEEICDLRQPVIFGFQNERLMENCNLNTTTDNYGAFDIKLRNIKDNDDETEMYVPLTLNAASKVFDSDTESRFLSENNTDFLEETGIIKTFRYNDSFLRPYMVSDCIYDFSTAAEHTETPLRYDINYRNYYLVTQGKVKIKLIPPKSTRYLYQIKDYDNFEFRSPVNPWNIQHEYKPDFDKIKTLEVEILPGQIIFIPAFWWYSMKFEKQTSLCTFKYRSYMNFVAILPQLFMRLLQRQNVKREVVKKMSIDEKEKVVEKESKKSEESEEKLGDKKI